MSTKKSAGKLPHNRLTAYISSMWDIMTKRGHGYKMHSLRHTGKGADRRADKLRAVPTIETDEEGNEKQVINYLEFDPPESKIERGARLQTLTRRDA